MLSALFNYSFLQHAVIAAILSSIACGIIGTIIVEKKLVMLSGGIAHTAFGGVGFGYLLGIPPILGALVFSVASAIGITSIKRKNSTNTDTLIGMFWSLGMALGILFIAFMPGYPPDMTSYLFGDILNVSNFDIKMMCIMDLIIILFIISILNTLKSYLFDDEFSFTLGINTTLLEYCLFILIALAIVVLIKVVGIILIIALLTAPPAISKLFTYDFNKILVSSIILGMVFSFTGLWLSYVINIPSGASIILVTVLTYFITTAIKSLNQKYKLPPS
ncbi:high-affinity zinc uptake system membrane protein ZnuB [Clostridium tepidiprofundi DSM 19306]|uniref:High-affinity zinc uptake system membrane protein ZnuB n=1 Tax=Clostridium tepidiprofundi DSM 19306 TaxID=1121338 RepID=A0A151ATA1_9CLOT|nr:metal ABC transporter permease [Clostridium tepidiprofundi]KYH30884.1 high-affinity zinc uptake system membrane protein ZnuB [Clostridium tepidiprofundi DSM 19306]